MTASPGKFPALLLALAAVGGCTLWTKDFDRIIDQQERDFSIDPDRRYKIVDLAEIMAHPSTYKLMDVRFHAVVNRYPENVYTPLYTTFRQEDYSSFSVWPAEARLWEGTERLRSLPTLFMRKDNPNFQNIIDMRRYALVEIRARVMGDYEQVPWLEVLYVDPVIPVLYTDQSLADYKAGMDAVGKNVPAQAIAKLEAAVRAPLAPKVRVEVRMTLGRLYEARGDFERAAYHYDSILIDDENNDAAWDAWERCDKQIQAKRAAEGGPPPRRRK